MLRSLLVFYQPQKQFVVFAHRKDGANPAAAHVAVGRTSLLNILNWLLFPYGRLRR